MSSPLVSSLSRRRLLGASIATGGALALGRPAFGVARALQSTPKPGGSLTVGVTVFNAPEDFDPAVLAPNAVSPHLHLHVYERLLRLDADGKTVEPGLAESWEASPDGLAYTFLLRAARFHDGSTVTSGDVVWSLQRMRENPVLAGQTTAFTTETPDERTVAFRLQRPYAPFLNSLATPFSSILPKALVESQKKLFFEQPIGSGPFRFGSWDGETELVLTKNADYWEAGHPYLDELRLRIAPTVDEALALLTGGQADLLPFFPISQRAAVEAVSGVTIDQIPTFSTTALVINCDKPPFDDRNLRLALNYAIDRQALIAQAYQGLGTPAKGFIPPTVTGYDPDLPGFTYDLAKAQSLVAQSAAKDGFAADLIAFANDPVSVTGSHLIADALAKIGGTVTVLDDPNLDVGARLSTDRYDLIYDGGSAWNGDADAITHFMVHSNYTGDGLLTHYKNDQVDALADAAVAMPNGADRLATYAKVQQLVNDDPNWVFLVYPVGLVARRASIHDAIVQPQGYTRLWDAWRDAV